jgi:hypothetical protein
MKRCEPFSEIQYVRDVGSRQYMISPKNRKKITNTRCANLPSFEHLYEARISTFAWFSQNLHLFIVCLRSERSGVFTCSAFLYKGLTLSTVCLLPYFQCFFAASCSQSCIISAICCCVDKLAENIASARVWLRIRCNVRSRSTWALE